MIVKEINRAQLKKLLGEQEEVLDKDISDYSPYLDEVLPREVPHIEKVLGIKFYKNDNDSYVSNDQKIPFEDFYKKLKTTGWGYHKQGEKFFYKQFKSRLHGTTKGKGLKFHWGTNLYIFYNSERGHSIQIGFGLPRIYD
jgi:hypothetical protein